MGERVKVDDPTVDVEFDVPEHLREQAEAQIRDLVNSPEFERTMREGIALAMESGGPVTIPIARIDGKPMGEGEAARAMREFFEESMGPQQEAEPECPDCPDSIAYQAMIDAPVVDPSETLTRMEWEVVLRKSFAAQIATFSYLDQGEQMEAYRAISGLRDHMDVWSHLWRGLHKDLTILHRALVEHGTDGFDERGNHTCVPVSPLEVDPQALGAFGMTLGGNLANLAQVATNVESYRNLMVGIHHLMNERHAAATGAAGEAPAAGEGTPEGTGR